MCGRTSLFAPVADLRSRFDAEVPETYRPRYNVAPGAPLEVVTSNEPDQIRRFRWGFGRRGGEADGALFNARAETAAETEPFAAAWASRPCLVLSSGFYEWATVGNTTQPHRVHREGEPAFAMAGLYEEAPGEEGAAGRVTILTTDASGPVAPLHDRMPVVLPRDAEGTWLTGTPAERQGLCRPYPGEDLAAYPVSTAVNDPATDSPAVVEPAATEQSGLGEFG